MAVDSATAWGGYVKGAEISVLDFVALALYFTTPRTSERLPFRFVMLFYFLATGLSAFQALEPREALFAVWQLARMFLVYATISRGCADPRVTPAVLSGMAIGMFVEVGVVIWQRFDEGIIKPAERWGIRTFSA